MTQLANEWSIDCVVMQMSWQYMIYKDWPNSWFHGCTIFCKI